MECGRHQPTAAGMGNVGTPATSETFLQRPTKRQTMTRETLKSCCEDGSCCYNPRLLFSHSMCMQKQLWQLHRRGLHTGQTMYCDRHLWACD
jgi:hypothetical protein